MVFSMDKVKMLSFLLLDWAQEWKMMEVITLTMVLVQVVEVVHSLAMTGMAVRKSVTLVL